MSHAAAGVTMRAVNSQSAPGWGPPRVSFGGPTGVGNGKQTFSCPRRQILVDDGHELNQMLQKGTQ